MQISSLIQVINYLKAISGDTSLLNGYKKLSEIIKDASAKHDEDYITEIFREKEQLINILLESDPVGWGYSSYNLLDKINSNKLFGRTAADYIETLITPESKDYNGINTALNKKIKLFSRLSENLDTIQHLHDHVIPQDAVKPAVNTGNKASMLISFEGRLAVQNIDELERYTRLWDGILNAFSQMTGVEILSMEINSFSKNGIVLCVYADDKTMNALSTGIAGIESALPVILKIRKIQIEMVDLPLHNDINNLLEEEITSLVSNSSWTTSQKLLSLYGIDSIDEDEILGDVSRALKQILSFIEKGGKIKFASLVSDPEQAKSNQILVESFSIAQELESITGLLAQMLSKKEELVNASEFGE
jgi:hypothetical protein